MFHGKKVLALIPARSGSKRLPDKNILNLNGEPLIAWSIKAGLDSHYIDRVIVSTDSDVIADIARKFGADVPFMRPTELASDKATTTEVIKYNIEKLSDDNMKYDYVVLLQPTSPLRTTKHIDEALETMWTHNADGVLSVCAVEHPIEWTNTLPSNKSMDGFIKKENVNKRSQDFQKRFRLNGALYCLEIKRFLEEGKLFFDTGLVAYIMKTIDSIDVDTINDFELVKCIMQNRTPI